MNNEYKINWHIILRLISDHETNNIFLADLVSYNYSDCGCWSHSWSVDESEDSGWLLQILSSSSLKSIDEEVGLNGIWEWYQSRLSSRVSKMSWASGWTKSAQVSQRGCTM